jgi:hypothetical protein
MFKNIALAASLLLASAVPSQVRAQQSLQALHTRVPAPPANAAAAPAWLASAEITTLRQQIKAQRSFIEKLMKEAGDAQTAGASTGSIDFARAQRDPEYAKQLQARLASMSQEEQMKMALELQQATQAQALQDVQAMAADPEAVALAAEQYPEYQSQQASGGIAAQQMAIGDLQQKARARDAEISARASQRLKCGDGEGSCSAADQAADKATLRAAHAEIIAEYDKALVLIGQQVAAARKARAADIAHAQKYLAPARYGAAAQSAANKQLLAAYHNAVLNEIEQLMAMSEDSARFAAARVQDRTINFLPIE